MVFVAVERAETPDDGLRGVAGNVSDAIFRFKYLSRDRTGMEDDSGSYRVAVKDSATESNAAARDLDREVVRFDSVSEAHRRARRLSEEGDTPVKIQQAAPQDSDDVDGYLVAWPERRRWNPDGTPTEGLTFDTAANQYGALGEAVVLTPTVNPPVLTHFARVDADLSERETATLRVELDTDPDPVEVAGSKRWEPDCRAVVRLGPDRPVLTEYWCEVKTGDGSFERSQRAAMTAKAREATVLKIRVEVDDLPDSYTAWVRTVDPGEGEAVESEPYRIDSTLDDF